MREIVTDQVQQVTTDKVPQAVQKAIYTNLDNISVSITDEKAHVTTDFTAGVKWGIISYTPKVYGELVLANLEDQHIHAEGISVNPTEIKIPGPAHAVISRIAKAVRRDVEVPQSFKLQEPLQNAVGGQKINGLFMAALNTQLQTDERAAQISTIGLQFTPQNTLRVDLQGGASKAPLRVAA